MSNSKFAELKVAGFEDVSSDPSTFLFRGRVIWNNTEGQPKYYDGTTWVSGADAGNIGGILISNDSISSKTGSGAISSGNTFWGPNLNIKNTHTWTVDAGGYLSGIEIDVEAGGVLEINGTLQVLG